MEKREVLPLLTRPSPSIPSTPLSLTHARTLSPSLPFRWTVNLRFLPEPIFASKALSLALLATHAALLAAFASTRWVAGEPGSLPGVDSALVIRSQVGYAKWR